MPNKIISSQITESFIPEVGDIYRSGILELDPSRYILARVNFEKESYYVLVSLDNGRYWRYPALTAQDAVKEAIFVGRNMTITIS